MAVAYHEYIPQILNRTVSEWYGALHLIERNLDMPIEILNNAERILHPNEVWME